MNGAATLFSWILLKREGEMLIKQIIKKIVYRERADSETYITYLRKKGVRIGERTKFFAPRNRILI